MKESKKREVKLCRAEVDKVTRVLGRRSGPSSLLLTSCSPLIVVHHDKKNEWMGAVGRVVGPKVERAGWVRMDLLETGRAWWGWNSN